MPDQRRQRPRETPAQQAERIQRELVELVAIASERRAKMQRERPNGGQAA